MAKKPFQKEKLLFIARQLEEESDEQHPISTKEMIAMLSRNGIESERKSIYRDIECLGNNGWDIVKQDGKLGGYYLGSRDFELAELKLMVDAVQASKFITERKSHQLIQKIEKLCSRHEAYKLQRQVVVQNRTKTKNEKIFYNVDAIYTAIAQKHPITFAYCEWNEKKELVARHDGKRYHVSPGLLCWDDENYYLIAWEEENSILKHYRVDKMRDLQICDKERLADEKALTQLDPAKYAAKTFGMFAGEEKRLELSCQANGIGILVDRFGTNVNMMLQPDGGVKASVIVAVSNQFFGWISSIYPLIKINGPEQVLEQYQAFLRERLEDK